VYETILMCLVVALLVFMLRMSIVVSTM
jgi:hypothetical protein